MPQRPRRALPAAVAPPTDPGAELPPTAAMPWLEPCPRVSVASVNSALRRARPRPLWYDGHDGFIAGSAEHAAAGEHRLVPTSANRQPATAICLRRPGDSELRPLSLEVLRIEDGLVADIVHFSPDLLPAFGLPPTLREEAG